MSLGRPERIGGSDELRHRSMSTYGLERRRATWLVVAGVAIAALVAFGILSATGVAPDALTAAGAATGASGAPGDVIAGWTGGERDLPEGSNLGPATPYFASFEDIRLCLPVRPADLTILAFHQAAKPEARHMAMLVPETEAVKLCATPTVEAQAGTAAAGQPAATGAGDASAAASTPSRGTTGDGIREDGVWEGAAICLYRSNRYGPADSAADVGAPPGSPVYAPLDGKVIEIKPYQLYGRYDDVEIHIQPEGRPDLDLVLIHVADPLVEVGDEVVAGKTRVASVRKLSDQMSLQLAEYTPGGDHVHMQLNLVVEDEELPSVEGS
jgi:murein DD-endopeptidase MepM/ murein hydrolase activator NlpD